MFLPLVLFMIFQVIKRHNYLEDYSLSTAQVYEIHRGHGFRLNKTRRNVARYEYTFEGRTYDKSSEFYSFDVSEGDIFQIRISNKDPEIHEVEFSNKLNE